MGVVYSAVGKAEAFVLHLERTFLRNADAEDLNDSLEEEADEIVDELFRLRGRPLDPVSDEEVLAAVVFRDNKKGTRPGFHHQPGP